MRYVAIALVTAAALLIWLTMQSADDSVRVRIEPDVPLVAMPQETDFEDQAVSPLTTSDEAVTDTVEPGAADDPAIQTAEIEFGPEMRAGIVDYLTGSGLAGVDSERIADSALGGARDCVELAFNNGGRERTSYAIETCMLNVLASHGLNGIPATEAQLAISVP